MSVSDVPVKRDGSNGPIAARGGLFSFAQMRREFDQLFDRFFGGSPSLWRNFDQEPAWGIDMQDKEDSIFVRFEVPGFDAKEVDLKLSGNDLVLRAEHKAEVKGKGTQEESQASIYRSVTLPAGVIPERAEAKYANGLISVSIPKSDAGKARKIAIQAN